MADMEETKELFEIFAGTYEEYLLGFKFTQDEEGYKLEQTVADHTHKGSIRTLTARGNLLATGGFDEIIHIYNLDDNIEVGTLAQHTGTITCLTFTSDQKHLISCSEDGSIAIYRIGSWIMEKLWAKAHKGANVNWIAVHPSNKMAFSVGNDGNLRTWNLIEGVPAYVTNMTDLTKRLELVVWSPSGHLYAVPHENEITVYTVKTARERHIFKFDNKITSAHFVMDNRLCVGDMCGNLVTYDLDVNDKMNEQQVGNSRIKAITSHDQYIIVASSEGMLTVFELGDDEVTHVAKCDTSCRLTCVTVTCLCHRIEKKQKKKKPKVNGHIKTEVTDKKNTGINGQEKTEISNELREKIKRKKMVIFNRNKINNRSPPKKRKVGGFPKRQAWVVEEQDT